MGERKELTRNDLTPKGMAALAKWLEYCESIGWLPEQLPDLERTFLKYKDENGELR